MAAGTKECFSLLVLRLQPDGSSTNSPAKRWLGSAGTDHVEENSAEAHAGPPSKTLSPRPSRSHSASGFVVSKCIWQNKKRVLPVTSPHLKALCVKVPPSKSEATKTSHIVQWVRVSGNLADIFTQEAACGRLLRPSQTCKQRLWTLNRSISEKHLYNRGRWQNGLQKKTATLADYHVSLKKSPKTRSTQSLLLKPYLFFL